MDLILYTCEININTLELTERSHKLDEEYPDYDDMSEKANFGKFIAESIYVESMVSAKEARRLVMERCGELGTKFRNAHLKLWKDK